MSLIIIPDYAPPVLSQSDAATRLRDVDHGAKQRKQGCRWPSTTSSPSEPAHTFVS
jgi:hypothetical protein